MKIRAATRGSPLALWQTNKVISLLSADFPELETEIVIVETTGDKDRETSLSELGGQGAFVKEVQLAVLEGKADFAIHSAKDLPAMSPDGLQLVAFPERADSRDVLVGKHWEELPHEACIATGSIRRKAHLLHQRPDLCFEDLRGNIETRLKKAEHYDAIVMAKAALDRLGLTPEVVDVLDPSILLPQVGQGALAIETRSQDENLKAIFSEIDHVDTHRAVLAERAFLHELGSGCDLPVAANAVVSGDGISLTAVVSSVDGKSLLRTTETGQESLSLGKSVAQNLLDTQGGRELLKKQ